MSHKQTAACVALILLALGGCSQTESPAASEAAKTDDAPAAALIPAAEAPKAATRVSQGIPAKFQGDFEAKAEDCTIADHPGRLTITRSGYETHSETCKWKSTTSVNDQAWEGTLACQSTPDAEAKEMPASLRLNPDGRLGMTGSDITYAKCDAEAMAELKAAPYRATELKEVTCDVKDAFGRPVVFSRTVDVRHLHPSITDPCDIARDLAEFITRYANRSVDNFCEDSPDICLARKREQMVLDYTPSPEVYSVGTGEWQEKKECPAYLFVVSWDGYWDVKLRLLGECKDFEGNIDRMTRTKGGAYGDYVTRYVRYTGTVPKDIIFKGMHRPFQTQRPEPGQVSEDDKIAQEYAKELTAHWSHMDHCFDLMQQLYKYTGTGEAAAVQMKRMDVIYDGANRAGCISR